LTSLLALVGMEKHHDEKIKGGRLAPVVPPQKETAVRRIVKIVHDPWR
jgi:hypothetical protein